MPPPLPQIEGVEHRTATVNGIRLHYAEAGAGEPLLLVHGWPQHWWMWRNQIGPLAERYRVIVPDLRGHGWSEKPRSTYLKTELADDLIALLDSLGLDRVRYVGHDWGAYVGLLIALSRPERIERFVAIAIPHPWQRRFEPRVALASTYQLLLGGPLGKLVIGRGFVRAMLKAGRRAGSWSEEELRMYDSVLREPDATRASVRLYRSFVLHEAWRWAARRFESERLTVPTLWLIGEHDVLARLADDGYRDHADDMTLERLPGASHFVPEELPETVLDRTLAFL